MAMSPLQSGFEQSQLAMGVSLLISCNRCQHLADLMTTNPGRALRANMTVKIDADEDCSFSEEDVPVIINLSPRSNHFEVRLVYTPGGNLWNAKKPAEHLSSFQDHRLMHVQANSSAAEGMSVDAEEG